VNRDRNQASVIMWSLGNKCKNPEILRTILVQPYVNQMGETHVLHAYDPTRPWHYEQARDNFSTGIDVYSGMYETVEQMIAYAEAGHDTPYIECEYEHAMGNAMGNMDEYQAAFDTYRSLQGGFIWDFIDQSIYQTAEDGTRYFGYGGDFGERVHDDNFCANGLLLPDRTLQPEMAEVRYQYSQLKFDAFDEDHATVRMKNYFLFTDVAEKYEFRWNITADGDVAAEGVLSADAVRVANVDARTNQPGERVVTLNLPTIAKEAGKEYFLNLTVALKAQDGLLNAGHVVAYEALMRVNMPLLRSPETIMKLAHEENRLYDIEHLTLFKGTQTFERLVSCGKLSPDAKLFINSIANVSLTDADFADFRRQFAPMLKKMVIEITEEEETMPEVLAIKRRQLGGTAVFALDDYGSGYSNSNNLLLLAPHYIKVDIAIIRGIDSNIDKQQVVTDVVTYAHARQMQVVAEGIENEAELRTVLRLGVDLLQGYFLARPAAIPDPIAPAALKILKDAHFA